ncbi:unnamed protein product, partial [marine sediment metagenome]
LIYLNLFFTIEVSKLQKNLTTIAQKFAILTKKVEGILSTNEIKIEIKTFLYLIFGIKNKDGIEIIPITPKLFRNLFIFNIIVHLSSDFCHIDKSLVNKL